MILSKNKVDSIDIESEINKKIKSGKLRELLLIVPTNRKVRYLKKDLISAAPKQSSEKINLETIGTFSTKLISPENTVKNKVLSEAASIVLLEQSFQETSLGYFSAYKKEIPVGTLDRVKWVISEYKKQGITSEDLRREADSLTGSKKIKALDISDIYEAYQKRIKLLNVKETGDIYSELNLLERSRFEKKFRELFQFINLVIIDGFDEFTSPEIEIINSISEIKKLSLYLSFDYYEHNPLIFSHLDNCYNKLRQKGFSPIVDKATPLFQQFQSDVKEKLFAGKSKEKTNSQSMQITSYKSSITKIAASTREKEVEQIAKEIRGLILNKQASPNRICVAFNLIQEYSPIISDIFEKFNIPVNLTDRFSLSTSPPVISIINFLEILENDYYYKNIFRALSGGYLSQSGYIKIGNIDLSNLLKASIKLRIISGLENWKASLSEAINAFEDEDNGENYSSEKEIFKRAENDIRKIEEILEPFGKNLTIDKFYENLLNLIFSLNLPATLLNGDAGSIERNIKAVDVFLKTVKEILKLLKDQHGAEKKFPLTFFMNNLRTVSSFSRYNIKEKPGFGVLVTTLNEIRGLEFDYLFISGLCDGGLPTRYSPEIFFSGSYVRNERLHQTEERYHFYQSLCSWQKELYLTFPMRDETKTFAKSNFLSEFENVFSIQNKIEADYSDTIYSKEGLLKYAGRKNPDNLFKNFPKIHEILNIEKIKHAVEVEKIRNEDPFGDSEFTGFIGENLSEKGKEMLAEFENKEYSISQLETYAKCPFKYFAERVLKLEVLKKPSEEIEALEMGGLLHTILYEFYVRLKEKKIVLSECDNEIFEQTKDFIFKIAEEKIKEANYNSPLAFYEKEKILGINNNKRNSLLSLFLEKERENNEFKPEFFEAGFGRQRDETKSYLENLKAGTVRMAGKIDRIDINKNEGKFKVVDYKLGGKKPSENDLLEGLALQLPLYLHAGRELIKEELSKNFKPIGGEIYSLKPSTFGNTPVKVSSIKKRYAVDDDSVYEKLIEICIAAIEKYVKGITCGNFKLTQLKDREKKVCGFCDYKAVCRIQEVN